MVEMLFQAFEQMPGADGKQGKHSDFPGDASGLEEGRPHRNEKGRNEERDGGVNGFAARAGFLSLAFQPFVDDLIGAGVVIRAAGGGGPERTLAAVRGLAPGAGRPQ